MKTNEQAKQEAIKAASPPTGEVMTAEETEEANFWQKQSSMLKLEKQVAEFKARAEAAEQRVKELEELLEAANIVLKYRIDVEDLSTHIGERILIKDIDQTLKNTKP